MHMPSTTMKELGVMQEVRDKVGPTAGAGFGLCCLDND